MERTLIDVAQLEAHLPDPTWRVFDCRFRLGDPEYGRSAFLESTIPGARHVDLERDLSGPIVAGRTGRHPLPEADAFARTLRRLGVEPHHQLVAFDDAGGAFAARLWWMMRWMGHDAVAVLDGGWQAWQRAGAPVCAGTLILVDDDDGNDAAAPPYPARVRPELVATVDELLAQPQAHILLDARAPDRYAGLDETIDPIAGHIAGALNLPYAANLDAQGRFRAPEELAARFENLGPPQRMVCYCGSGVTACHNILAMAHAGLEGARLYPGSWSEWIIDPSRPREPA